MNRDLGMIGVREAAIQRVVLATNGFGAVVRSELDKIRTLRGLWLTWLAGVASLPLVTLLIAGSGGLGEQDTLISGATSGVLVPLLIWAGWASWLSAGEYGSGTIASSVTLVGDRLRFGVAKIVAAALLVVIGAVVASAASLVAVGTAAPPGGHETGSPGAFGWVALIAAAVAVSAVSVGFLVRSPLASVTVVLIALLAPKGAGSLLGGLEPWVVGASPSTVITQLVHGAQLADAQTFPAGPQAGVLVVVLVALVLAVAALANLSRRDL